MADDPSIKRIAPPEPAALTPRGARICPRCRATVGPTDPAGGALAPITRCPRDGAAVVPIEALAAADGDPFLGATVANRFVVLERLGAGSMGTIYRAWDEAGGREVAVKILRADHAHGAAARARFAIEAQAMQRLSSPHAVELIDFGEVFGPTTDELAPEEASLYLAMELLDGESLGARIARRQRLPQTDALPIARGVLLALAEAHDARIIHRDLKPDNVFLCSSSSDGGGPRVKLLDFGVAKLDAEPDDRRWALFDTMTSEGVIGTPRYMSPEQAQGKDVDARSDLYAVGVLLYQMLVGHTPFADGDAAVVMARHIGEAPVAPIDAAPDASIEPALSALVMAALSKDRARRPPDARAFLAALADIAPPSTRAA